MMIRELIFVVREKHVSKPLSRLVRLRLLSFGGLKLSYQA